MVKPGFETHEKEFMKEVSIVECLPLGLRRGTTAPLIIVKIDFSVGGVLGSGTAYRCID